MFNYWCGGIDASHKKGDMCVYANDFRYLVVQHHNDYMYTINRTVRYGKGGELLILSPGNSIIHGSPKGSDIPYVDDWLIISGQGISELIRELRLPLNISFDIADSRFIAPHITRIRNELLSRKIGNRFIASNMISEMLVAIGRRYDSIIGSSIPQKERFDQIRDKMIANYSNEWKLSQLADMSGYSQSYFCSKYKKLYGISPIDELLSFRINQAKNELLRKNCSITEISEKCGFASIQHFSRYFKRLVGMTPSEYANQTPKTVAK